MPFLKARCDLTLKYIPLLSLSTPISGIQIRKKILYRSLQLMRHKSTLLFEEKFTELPYRKHCETALTPELIGGTRLFPFMYCVVCL